MRSLAAATPTATTGAGDGFSEPRATSSSADKVQIVRRMADLMVILDEKKGG